MNAPKVTIQELDLTQTLNTDASSTFGVMGITERGKVNNPEKKINSWNQFVKHFGGLSAANNDFPLQCKRALERGASLRVTRILHYTDINDGSTVDGAIAAQHPSYSNVFSSTDLQAGDAITVSVNNAPIPLVVNFQGSHNATMAEIAKQSVTYYPTLVGAAKVIPGANSGASNRLISLTAMPGVTLSNVVLSVAGSGTPPTVTTTSIPTIENSTGDTLLTFTALDRGAAYNDVVVEVLPSNTPGTTNAYFNLRIYLKSQPDLVENYNNLYLLPTANGNEQAGILSLLNSDLVAFNIGSVAALATTIQRTPLYGIYGFSAGADGAAPVVTDYIGSTITKTGLRSFDAYDDIVGIASLGVETPALAGLETAGTGYAENRGDIVYFIHLDTNLTTVSGLQNARTGTLVDSSYAAFFAGGLQVIHPTSGLQIDISELGDTLGIAAQSIEQVGPHWSFAGPNRGVYQNTVGVVSNFGSMANVKDADDLANYQINIAVNRSGQVLLLGNLTAQKELSALSFLNTRLLINAMKKDLTPYLSQYIDEPNDIATWKKIYYGVKPYFEALTNQRAFIGGEDIGWKWEGDQSASSMDKLTVNDPTQVALGKYKIRLWIKTNAALREIDLAIILTPAGISFDESISLIQNP